MSANKIVTGTAALFATAMTTLTAPNAHANITGVTDAEYVYNGQLYSTDFNTTFKTAGMNALLNQQDTTLHELVNSTFDANLGTTPSGDSEGIDNLVINFSSGQTIEGFKFEIQPEGGAVPTIFNAGGITAEGVNISPTGGPGGIPTAGKATNDGIISLIGASEMDVDLSQDPLKPGDGRGTYYVPIVLTGSICDLGSFDIDLVVTYAQNPDPVSDPSSPAPEPATLSVFGMGLAALGYAKKRSSTNNDLAPVRAAQKLARRTTALIHSLAG